MDQISKRPLWRLVVAIAIVIVGIAIVVNTVGNIASKPDQEFKAAPVITSSTNEPEEKLPKEAGYTWQGLENDPKSIAIPAIGVDALIQNVGLDQNSQIAVPNNIHIAGWFVDSVRPGEKGLSILDGHVNGRVSDNGVFKQLPNLVVGEKVTITSGDGSVKIFEVHSNQSVTTADAASILFSQVPSISNQLNLITCTGNFDNTTQTYSNRQIVVLKLLP